MTGWRGEGRRPKLVLIGYIDDRTGRIERLFKTLQDRLVKEMRLKGIKTTDEANEFLER